MMRTRTSKVLTLVLALIANLLVAEAVFYFFLPQPAYAVRYSPWGWEHLPNISFKTVPESKEVVRTIEYNSDGFLGAKEYQEQRDEGILRIAILGDSETEGVVDYDYLFSTVLEQALVDAVNEANFSGISGAQVINAGVYGYEPCQFLRLFESRVLNYQPDIVYVVHNGKGAEDRFCDLDDGRLIYKDLQYTSTQYYLRWGLSYIRSKSQLANTIYRLLRHYLVRDLPLPKQFSKNMFKFAPPNASPLEGSRVQRSGGLSAFTGLDTFSLASNGFAEGENQSPNLTQLIYKRIHDHVSSYGGTTRVIFASKRESDAPIAKFLNTQAIEFFDMAAYLENKRTKAIRFPINGHWNEYGNHLVAMTFFEIVTQFDFKPSLVD